MRLTADACGVAVRSIEAARRGCGRVLAITRGWRHAAHGLACGVMRGCVPIVVQEGDVAVYWPSPAACAQYRQIDILIVSRKCGFGGVGFRW